MAAIGRRLPDSALKITYSAAAAALAACTRGVLHGVCVVADDHTETVAYAAAGQRRHRTSGWGPLFMDGGSAYDLAARALLASVKAHDGRGAPTTLTRALLRRLQLGRAEDLLRWAYTPAERRAERVAGLARVVADCAMAGDPVADTILRHGVGELQRCCRTSAAAVGLGAEPFKVVLAGRLLQESGLYAHYVSEAIKEQVPGSEIVYPESEPAEAAALMALQHWALRQAGQQALQGPAAPPPAASA